jgi:hypothetical protein
MRLICYCAATWLVGGALLSAAEPTDVQKHIGMCDASAAVALSNDLFAVANDEDNLLRVYDRRTGGEPRQTFDLTAFLKPDPDHPEVDIEACTQVGDTVYWLSSHGANVEGKKRTSRRRFFATRFTVQDDRVSMAALGRPYQNLVADLNKAPSLEQFNLEKAAKFPPKSKGALNVEGLAPGPKGALWIGLRNPIPEGKALLIPLENPREVLSGKEKARLGSPLRLDLGGLGIRSIEYWHQRGSYVIIAGPFGPGECRLCLWTGRAADKPEPVEQVQLKWSAEALVIYPDSEATRLQLVSDDGTVEGCKMRKDPLSKVFRTGWVEF